jgi:hypothetical protein
MPIRPLGAYRDREPRELNGLVLPSDSSSGCDGAIAGSVG